MMGCDIGPDMDGSDRDCFDRRAARGVVVFGGIKGVKVTVMLMALLALKTSDTA